MNEIVKKLSKIEEKIDKQAENLSNIDKTLYRQQIDIEHHIKRTDLLEEKVERFDKFLTRIEALAWVLASVYTVSKINSVFNLF